MAKCLFGFSMILHTVSECIALYSQCRTMRRRVCWGRDDGKQLNYLHTNHPKSKSFCCWSVPRCWLMWLQVRLKKWMPPCWLMWLQLRLKKWMPLSPWTCSTPSKYAHPDFLGQHVASPLHVVHLAGAGFGSWLLKEIIVFPSGVKPGTTPIREQWHPKWCGFARFKYADCAFLKGWKGISTQCSLHNTFAASACQVDSRGLDLIQDSLATKSDLKGISQLEWTACKPSKMRSYHYSTVCPDRGILVSELYVRIDRVCNTIESLWSQHLCVLPLELCIAGWYLAVLQADCKARNIRRFVRTSNYFARPCINDI